jgi:hypothetical protein
MGKRRKATNEDPDYSDAGGRGKKPRAVPCTWSIEATDVLFKVTKVWMERYDGNMGSEDSMYDAVALDLNKENAAWNSDPEAYTALQCKAKVHNTQQKARKWYNSTALKLTQQVCVMICAACRLPPLPSTALPRPPAPPWPLPSTPPLAVMPRLMPHKIACK